MPAAFQTFYSAEYPALLKRYATKLLRNQQTSRPKLHHSNIHNLVINIMHKIQNCEVIHNNFLYASTRTHP